MGSLHLRRTWAAVRAFLRTWRPQPGDTRNSASLPPAPHLHQQGGHAGGAPWTCACGCSHAGFVRACHSCGDRRRPGVPLCGAVSDVNPSAADVCVLPRGHAGVHQDWVGGCWGHDARRDRTNPFTHPCRRGPDETRAEPPARGGDDA